MAVFQILTTLAECSAILAAFVGVARIFRINVLLERRRDAEAEVRFWTKRLPKQDTFAVPFGEVRALLSNEQTRVVADPPHEDSARRRDRRRPPPGRSRAHLAPGPPLAGGMEPRGGGGGGHRDEQRDGPRGRAGILVRRVARGA